MDKDATPVNPAVWVFNDQNKNVLRSGWPWSTIYSPDQSAEYGFYSLFRKVLKNDGSNPGLAIDILHPYYLETGPKDRVVQKVSWEQWLRIAMGMHCYPQLLRSNDSRDKGQAILSAEMEHIIHFCSPKLLSVINAHLAEYQTVLPFAANLLKESMVVSETRKKIRLGDSYLPFPDLKMVVKSLNVKDFPFLKLDVCVPDVERKIWDFATQFGVGIFDDLAFRMRLLQHVTRLSPEDLSRSCTEEIMNMYESIKMHCKKDSRKEQIVR